MEIIDKFFDSLKLDQIDPDKNTNEVSVGNVPFGQLMSMLSTNKRWVYAGSATKPPCSEKVYWNVATKVYPINGKHLQAFQYLIGKEMRKLQKAGSPLTITTGGNYRAVQEIKKQDPKIMEPVVD